MQGAAASFKLDTAAAERTTLDEIDLMLGVNPVCTPRFQFSDECGEAVWLHAYPEGRRVA